MKLRSFKCGRTKAGICTEIESKDGKLVFVEDLRGFLTSRQASGKQHELLSCPFCGCGDIHIEKYYYDRHNRRYVYYINCMHCGARTGDTIGLRNTKSFWNKRSHNELLAELSPSFPIKPVKKKRLQTNGLLRQKPKSF